MRSEVNLRLNAVGRLLILPEDRTVRRIVDRHAETMATVYPARGREIRAWLREPARPLRGIWFLSNPRNTQRVDDDEPHLLTALRHLQT